VSRGRRRILFVCGSINQTTQMHQVVRELPEHEHAFTPYYCERATREMREAAPGVGLALGKECHSCFDLDELRRHLPVQNGCVARNVAAVCREVLAESPVRERGQRLPGLAVPAAEAS
jgi:hypothetical protein